MWHISRDSSVTHSETWLIATLWFLSCAAQLCKIEKKKEDHRRQRHHKHLVNAVVQKNKERFDGGCSETDTGLYKNICSKCKVKNVNNPPEHSFRMFLDNHLSIPACTVLHVRLQWLCKRLPAAYERFSFCWKQSGSLWWSWHFSCLTPEGN